MTLEKLLTSRRLKLAIKKFIVKNKDIFDIIIYGSAVRGKTKIRDIDVAVISSKKRMIEEKLHLAQQLKNEIKNIFSYEMDIRCVDMEDLSDSAFLARKGIIAEGYSLIKNKPLVSLFGFETKVLFAYSLGKLKPSQKITFQYIMKGRRGQKGLLELREGKPLGKGVVIIPLRHCEEFKELFEKLNIDYKILPAVFY